MPIDPPPAELRRLAHLAADLAADHHARLPGLRVARRATAAEMRAAVDEALPRRGLGIEASLRHFYDHLLPTGTLVHHPRFFAYVPGPGSFAGAVGAAAAAATNLFVGTWLGGAGMAQLELTVLDWLRQALALPAGVSGILTSGGSMANLGALAAARARAGVAPGEGVVYTSAATHYSVAKAAGVLGFGVVRALPVDGADRLQPAAVRDAVRADRAAGLVPVALCATAGSTGTGAVDPLAELADLAAELALWLHVDAAYGGAAALLPELRPALAGLERADSITLDPHKWLYAPFECGCLLTRHTDILRAAFTADADYMQDVPRDEVNFFERGPELTRGNRALPLWMLLRSVGLDAVAAAVREDIRLCQLACALLREDPRVEIVTEPSLSIFTFAVRKGEEQSRALVERILADGFLMLSSGRVAGRFVLRWCVVNHRTDETAVRESVARVRALL